MFKVLINDSFKKYLLSQSEKNRERIKQKFEFLEIGTWDGGLKVKKIKGVASNKTVFEARLDKANRILFTLGYDETQHDKSTLLIYVWGIVAHDDISQKSKNILPENVPFIYFKPYKEELSEELYFNELDDKYVTQESITKKVSDDSGQQKWYTLAGEEWQRVQSYTKDDFELYLQLTPVQSTLLTTPLPIMLSGTAGSGKTTLSIYYLLKTSLNPAKKLFITYNNFLKNMAERLYYALLNSSELESKVVKPEFYTYKNLCLEVAGKFNRHFHLEKEVDYYKFRKIIQSNPLAAKYDAPLVWEEIRSIIKGALPQINVQLFKEALVKIKQNQVSSNLLNSLQQQFNIFSNLESSQQIEKITQKYFQTNLLTFNKNIKLFMTDHGDRAILLIERIIELLLKQRELTQKRHLSFLEYEMLGRKKAPNFKHDRKNIYKVFEFYQDKLDGDGLWDELDLSREVINILVEREPAEYVYDIVACDEVQDLTDSQHNLLFYLVRNPLNLLLTGDVKQIINPSGFRWEELKRHFYDRELPTPQLTFLNLNFRSSGSIVELANTLLELKGSLLGTSAEELKEDWKYKGRPPVVAFGLNEKEMIENIKGIGAKKTILVRNEDEKNKLKNLFETELVFTIYEAKGLEFDTVFLWKFCSEIKTSDIWKVILEDSRRDTHDANIKHELNLLYVAITRAQKELLIYDGKNPSVIWQSDLLKEQIYQTDEPAYINKLWNVISTPEEWIEQGNYFFEREFYKAAIECFKNSGNELLTAKAEAFYREKIGEYYKAAVNFEKLGEKNKAAENYERCGDFYKALQLYNELQLKDKILACTIKTFEKEKRFEELANIYLSIAEYQKALDSFVKSGNYQMAAEISYNFLKDIAGAAKYYEQAGSFADSAKLYLKLKKIEHAAELYEKANDFPNAVKLWRKLKNQQRLIKIYQTTKQLEPLLLIYEKERSFENSVKVLREMVSSKEIDLKGEANAYFKKKNYFSALIRFYLANDNNGVAESAFKLKYFSDSAKYFDLAGNHFQAARSYYKIKKYEEAFSQYLNSPEDEQLNFVNAKKIGNNLGREKLVNEAKSFTEQKKYLQAFVCYDLMRDGINAGFCQIELGNIEQAYSIWNRTWSDDRFEIIADRCLEKNTITIGVKYILSLSFNSDNPYFYKIDLYSSNSRLVKMMSIYFQDNNDTKELEHWVFTLKKLDVDYHYYEEICQLYERIDNYNSYYAYLVKLKHVDKKKFDKIRIKYEIEYEHLKNTVSELAAIKLYFINKKENYEKIIEQLPVNNNNYKLFVKSKHIEKAARYLADNNMMEYTKELLLEKGDHLLLGKIQEEKGMIGEAAHSYRLSGEFIKSAELYFKIDNKEIAADMFVRGKKYQSALNIYLQLEKKNYNKITELYEKLGEYRKAGELYLKLRKPKKAEKCFKKITKPGLFDNIEK